MFRTTTSHTSTRARTHTLSVCANCGTFTERLACHLCYTDPTRKLLPSKQSSTSTTTPRHHAFFENTIVVGNQLTGSNRRFALWKKSKALCLKNLDLNLTLWEALRKLGEFDWRYETGAKIKTGGEKQNWSWRGKESQTRSSIPAHDHLINFPRMLNVLIQTYSRNGASIWWKKLILLLTIIL